MHTYLIGGHEVVIRPPSGDAFDRYIDSQFRQRSAAQQSLLLDCVASPDPATLQGLLATKPAWKSKIVNACEALAGDDLKASAITDAEQPGCKALTIGVLPFVFRPADADQYDVWESRVKAMTSHATLDLTGRAWSRRRWKSSLHLTPASQRSSTRWPGP